MAATTIQSMLAHMAKQRVSLCETASGYRVSTRNDGTMYDILHVAEELAVLQSDALQVRRLISLKHIAEIEIALTLEHGETEQGTGQPES